ncbi:MAG TPA: GNAT family N-acetyltransferase [Syntrophorhabdaceae bacterium]|jgi:serine/threonine-protein kinase RsbW
MRTDQERSILAVPNDLGYLPAIQAYAGEIAKKLGFSPSDTAKIILALEEAVVNVVEHAFEAGEKESYEVIFEPVTAGVRIIIKDKGMPFDPSMVPEYATPVDVDQVPTGLGSHLMKTSVDEFEFHNLGREGKEIHLIKFLPFKSVVDLHEASQLTRYEPEKEKVEEKKAYELRSMLLSESLEVSRLFYRAYGYSYGIESIYYPDRFTRLHEDGTIASVVTVADGEVVGHVALVKEHRESIIAEAAMAVVRPDFRGQGCQNGMLSALVDKAHEIGLAAIFSKAVTNHPYAQKAGQKAGFKRCALVLGLIPADRSFKGIHAALSQRETVIYGFMPLKNPQGITIYPPPQHAEFIEYLYHNLGLDRTMGTSPAPEAVNAGAGDGTSKITTTVVSTYNRAIITIERYGEHIADEVKVILKDLCLKKIDQITFYLPLENPATPSMCGEFEKLGFFFGGVLPFYDLGDALILQYLNNVSIDYSRIQVASEAAEKIVAYIKARDPNQNA